jgi:hypothetical protein
VCPSQLLLSYQIYWHICVHNNHECSFLLLWCHCNVSVSSMILFILPLLSFSVRWGKVLLILYLWRKMSFICDLLYRFNLCFTYLCSHLNSFFPSTKFWFASFLCVLLRSSDKLFIWDLSAFLIQMLIETLLSTIFVSFHRFWYVVSPFSFASRSLSLSLCLYLFIPPSLPLFLVCSKVSF